MRVYTFLLTFFAITISFLGNAQLNQGNCPNNIDFEFGDFTNWRCYIGSAAGIPSVTTPSAPDPNRHVIFNASNSTGLVDPYGQFPVLCPNGSGTSIRLGEDFGGADVGDGSKGEKISYVFTIPIGLVKYSLTYYYATVLNRGGDGHTEFNQPRFTVSLTNALSGIQVPCSNYDFNAQNPAAYGFDSAGFVGFGGSQVYFKTWTPVTVDLSGLNGQTIKLEFTTNDCHPGAHFGYAYIDVGATCITPVNGYAYCIGDNSVTLTAPFGYQSYFWYNQNYTQTLGTSQTLTISPPPPNGTIYNIDLVPMPSGGCRDTLEVIVEEQAIPDTPVAVSYINYCLNEVATQLQATPNTGYITQWYTVPTGGTPLGSPPVPNTSTAGITNYYVSQKSFGGCEGPRKKVTVEILAPPVADFSINDTIQCLVANSFAFTSTSTNTNAATQYEWDFGDASGLVTNTATPTHVYQLAGNFTVTLKVKNSTNCLSQKFIPVTVVTTPTANFNVVPNCAGTSFSFVNTTTGGSIQNVYTWDFGGGLTSPLPNPVVVLNTSGTINVKLTATEGTCTHDTTKPVVVHPNPKANFTFSNICTGDSTQFTATATIASGAITAYTWDFGSGNTSSLPNPKFKFAGSGMYPVKLTVASGFNCSKDTTITVTINEKPIANFLRADTACLNAFFVLKDSSYFATNIGNSTINQWWWNAGSNIYITKDLLTLHNSVGSYLVNQVVTSDKGCVSDTNKVVIDIKPLPVAQWNISNPLCFNRDISFGDITPNSKTRNWTLSNGYTSTQKNFTVNNLITGTTNVQLIVKDSFGCQGLVKDTNIIINPRPRLSFTYTDSCLEKIVPFMAMDLDNNYITQWKWDFEGYVEDGTTNKGHLFAKPGINNVYLYGIAANGCVSDTAYRRLNIYHTDAYAGEDRLAADNEPIQLLATGGITYQWTPNFKLNKDTIFNPIATVNFDQLYKVKVTSKFGCTSFDEVRIKIYKGPDIYIPTIFTPNRDGKNDDLKITLVGIKEFKYLTIYNRLGAKVFTTTDPTKSWNGTIKGKNVETETYVFVCSAVDINGKTINKKGTVIVVR
jgi:gliding motility-associated-like protein